MTSVINPAVGCHYFPPGPQLLSQPLRGLLPISLLGEQRHDGCEQFDSKTVTRQRRDCDLNPGPTALTTRLPRHPIIVIHRKKSLELKSGTLSLHLSVPVPVLTPFVVTSRPTTASRPSNPLNPSPLAPQIRLLFLRVYKLYLLTYLLTIFVLPASFSKLPSMLH